MTRSTNDAHLPGLRQPAPANDGLDAPFWEGTRAHELRVQRCKNAAAISGGQNGCVTPATRLNSSG